MQSPIRALLGLAGLLALVLTLSAGTGVAPTADAAKPTPTPSPGPTPTPPPIPPGLRAGLRASDYGISPFPSPSWWVSSIQSMAARFPGSVGEQVAVVVEVAGGAGGPSAGLTSRSRRPGRGRM
jgi:hypothetical protein